MSEPKSIDYSDAAEIKQIRQVAREVFGLKLGKIVQSGADFNLVGIKTEYVLVSHRLDSRTYFVHDTRYGTDRKAGVFRGSDREYTKICRNVLEGLRIPISEIAMEDILKEQTQVAEVNHGTQEVRMEEVQEGKYIARLSRQVEGLPVWSSSFMLGLTKDRNIGYMELHWPEIPHHILLEAHRLDYKIRRKWNPPDWANATVEVIEAGIIHSPAISLFMDIYPVIRVIYRSTDLRYGVKPVLYLDRHSKSVPIPRQAELPIETPQERKLPEQQESS